MKELLRELLGQTGIGVGEKELDLLAEHWALLSAANQRFNLTAILAEEAAAEKHYLDSLLLLPRLREAAGPGMRLADIGSGGGLPAIPLAICLPEVDFILLEATGKKCAFLTECGEKLGLANLFVRKLRAEEAGQEKGLRSGFDLVTARAVANLPVLLEYALPLLRQGGRFFAYKGAGYGAELAASRHALQVLGGKVAAAHAFTLPASGEARYIIEIKKEKATPAAYPRRPGQPGKTPL